MAFFDNLSKSLSSAGHNVAKQTKTLADTAQYNTSIADRKRQIAKLYAELGESYYRNHRLDTDSEEQERIDRINDLNEEIVGLEDKIREVKGYVKCPGCGADIAPGVTFCNSCGTRILSAGQVKSETETICPACGTELPEGSAFCTNCGARINATAEKVPERNRKGRVCIVCGAELEEGALFCTSCGARIEDAGTEEPTADNS